MFLKTKSRETSRLLGNKIHCFPLIVPVIKCLLNDHSEDHWKTYVDCIALHCIALHCIALHYITEKNQTVQKYLNLQLDFIHLSPGTQIVSHLFVTATFVCHLNLFLRSSWNLSTNFLACVSRVALRLWLCLPQILSQSITKSSTIRVSLTNSDDDKLSR